MSSIVSDDSDPFLIVIELTLQLDYKADNLAALRIKLNAQGNVIFQQAAKFDMAHLLSFLEIVSTVHHAYFNTG